MEFFHTSILPNPHLLKPIFSENGKRGRIQISTFAKKKTGVVSKHSTFAADTAATPALRKPETLRTERLESCDQRIVIGLAFGAELLA
jgi:hypothetical protein